MIETVPAFIPQIAGLMQGVNWDISEQSSATYVSESSDHPIEDPVNSFTSDHNREKPTRLDLRISVSAHPAHRDASEQGAQRINSVVTALLELRAQQAVSTSAYFTVITGIRAHNNMQINRMRTSRSDKDPGVMEIDLSLEEKRFSTAPRLSAVEGLLDAADGPRSTQNELLANESDRMILEQTFDRRRVRTGVMLERDYGTIPPPFADFGA